MQTELSKLMQLIAGNSGKQQASQPSIFDLTPDQMSKKLADSGERLARELAPFFNTAESDQAPAPQTALFRLLLAYCATQQAGLALLHRLEQAPATSGLAPVSVESRVAVGSSVGSVALGSASLPQRKPPCALQNPSIFGKDEKERFEAIQKRALFGIGFRKFKTEDGSWLIKDSDGRYLALLIPDARIADAMIAGLEAAV